MTNTDGEGMTGDENTQSTAPVSGDEATEEATEGGASTDEVAAAE